MSYTPIINDILEVRHYCVEGPQTAINVLHARVTALGGGGLTQQQIAASAGIAIGNFYRACLNNTAVYYGVGVQKVAPLPRLASEYSSGGSGGGTGGADPLPYQVCGFIKKFTILAGRHGLGRMYVAFPPRQAQAAAIENPTPAYQANVAVLSTFVTGSITYTVGGASTSLDYGLYDVKNKVFTSTIGAVMIPKWATQRRRGDYGRVNAPPF